MRNSKNLSSLLSSNKLFGQYMIECTPYERSIIIKEAKEVDPMLAEGIWQSFKDAAKYHIGNLTGKATDMNDDELAQHNTETRDLIGKSEVAQICKGQINKNFPNFPNNKGEEKFKQAVGSIAAVYDTLNAAARNGEIFKTIDSKTPGLSKPERLRAAQEYTDNIVNGLRAYAQNSEMNLNKVFARFNESKSEKELKELYEFFSWDSGKPKKSYANAAGSVVGSHNDAGAEYLMRSATQRFLKNITTNAFKGLKYAKLIQIFGEGLEGALLKAASQPDLTPTPPPNPGGGGGAGGGTPGGGGNPPDHSGDGGYSPIQPPPPQIPGGGGTPDGGEWQESWGGQGTDGTWTNYAPITSYNNWHSGFAAAMKSLGLDPNSASDLKLALTDFEHRTNLEGVLSKTNLNNAPSVLDGMEKNLDKLHVGTGYGNPIDQLLHATQKSVYGGDAMATVAHHGVAGADVGKWAGNNIKESLENKSLKFLMEDSVSDAASGIGGGGPGAPVSRDFAREYEEKWNTVGPQASAEYERQLRIFQEAETKPGFWDSVSKANLWRMLQVGAMSVIWNLIKTKAIAAGAVMAVAGATKFGIGAAALGAAGTWAGAIAAGAGAICMPLLGIGVVAGAGYMIMQKLNQKGLTNSRGAQLRFLQQYLKPIRVVDDSDKKEPPKPETPKPGEPTKPVTTPDEIKKDPEKAATTIAPKIAELPPSPDKEKAEKIISGMEIGRPVSSLDAEWLLRMMDRAYRRGMKAGAKRGGGGGGSPNITIQNNNSTGPSGDMAVSSSVKKAQAAGGKAKAKVGSTTSRVSKKRPEKELAEIRDIFAEFDTSKKDEINENNLVMKWQKMAGLLND